MLGSLYYSLGFGERRKMKAGKHKRSIESTTTIGLLCK